MFSSICLDSSSMRILSQRCDYDWFHWVVDVLLPEVVKITSTFKVVVTID